MAAVCLVIHAAAGAVCLPLQHPISALSYSLASDEQYGESRETDVIVNLKP